MSTNMVLFDMDGTLTEARRPLEDGMAALLEELLWCADAGVVTGSDYDFMREQLPQMTDIFLSRIVFLPCNGTKMYRFNDATDDYDKVHDNTLDDHLGHEKVQRMMSSIFDLQTALVKDYSIPLTGNFVQHRGSMINWCPIGRNATFEQREVFMKLDEENGIRNRFLKRLKRRIHNIDKDIICVIAGNTSFDIYPGGWNKTYALQHFSGHDNIWFVGDRCTGPGNDVEIYNEVSKVDRAYHTTGPEDTKRIILEIIERIKNENTDTGTD